MHIETDFQCGVFNSYNFITLINNIFDMIISLCLASENPRTTHKVQTNALNDYMS